MRSLIITRDPVLFSLAESLMKESGFAYSVLDSQTQMDSSGLQQIIVDDADYEAARRILRDGMKKVQQNTEW